MSIEFQGKVAGVTAIFYIPGQTERFCPTVQELRTKRTTNKVALQRTVPMESAKMGESEEDTLLRLMGEEIRILNASPLDIIGGAKRISVSELNRGVFVPVYSVPVSSKTEFVLGTHKNEVANLSWTPMAEIYNEPAESLYFRPGNFEAIASHLLYLADPQNYQPRMISYSELKHTIPGKLFDLVETGVSTETALSQLGLQWRRQLELSASPLTHSKVLWAPA